MVGYLEAEKRRDGTESETGEEGSDVAEAVRRK